MPASSLRSYQDALRFLYGLQGFGVKLGLENISRFLRERGNPQDALPAVHIAGSNGKGSTAAYLASILKEAGYRTALYTSPHLVDFRERMRVQGRMIPQAFVTRWVRKNRAAILRRRMTFFEATTALAFDWFRARDVDIAVIETGLGGRLDATNVLDPLLTVITSISLEHTHILGTTLKAIGREKAGIAKPGVPMVLGTIDPATERHVRSVSASKGAIVVSHPGLRVSGRTEAAGRMRVDIESQNWSLRGARSGYAGEHQVRNIRSVLRSLEVLTSSYGFRIGKRDIQRGLEHVRENTGLLARCSELTDHPRVFVDVAHNPAAMEFTSAHFLKRFGRRTMEVVFGIASDKDVRAVLRCLKPLVKHMTVVAARSPRSRDVNSILEVCRTLGIAASPASGVPVAVRRILRERRRRPVLVTGSHFVVGEALASLRRRKYLTITQ